MSRGSIFARGKNTPVAVESFAGIDLHMNVTVSYIQYILRLLRTFHVLSFAITCIVVSLAVIERSLRGS